MKKYFISTSVAALLLLYYFFDARKESFFPVCPLWKLTGFYCPGCGSQRAVSALLHGDILSAFSYNLLIPFSIPVIVYGGIAEFQHIFNKEIIKNNFFYKPWFACSVFVIVVLFFILRNIHVYPFSLLAPGGYNITPTN